MALEDREATTPAKKHYSRPPGFASMTPEKRREIAAMGGRAASASGRAYRWTRQQATEASRKGAEARARRGTHGREAGEQHV